jgi:hypothetical protein
MADYAFEKDVSDAENNQPDEAPEALTKKLDMNLSVDIGSLLLEDCQSYADIDAKEFSKRTAANICAIYKQLFEMKKQQDAKHGPDGEILEYDRPTWAVDMPESGVTLPREKPCPVEKPKTKWEKFREERGLPPRQKRSRLIYDEITKDWVPRWGPGSAKKIADQHNWLMENKPKHEEAGMNPFEYRTAEKKKALEK